MPSLQTTQPASTASYSQSAFAPDGVWRQEKLIVMKRGAVLPARCLRTNAPVSGARKKVNLYWHSPWLFLLIFVHLLVFIVVAMAARKSFPIEIAMSPEMIRRRNRLYLTGAAITLTGAIEFVLGTMQSGGDAFQIFLGFTAFFAGLFVAAIGGQTLTIQRMEGDYVWLKGASPEYLNGLSQWRGMPPS